MDDLEKLLADFDSEEETPVETEEVKENRPDSRGIKQIRDAYKRLERDHNKDRKELEELRAFRETVEEERATTTLTGAGLTDKQAAAFTRLYGRDVTPENVAAFKSDILGIRPEEPETTTVEWSPTASVSPDSPKSAVTFEQLRQMVRDNPAKAEELFRRGPAPKR